MTSTATIAEPAVAAIHDLARLTRPAITSLDTDEVTTLTQELTSLAAGVCQTLSQLSTYLNDTDRARTSMQHAAALAGRLVTALDTAHHDLSDTAETQDSEPEGVNFQPTKRGQISTGVDTGQRRLWH